MHNDYNLVRSLTPKEFEAAMRSGQDTKVEYIRSDDEDIRRIENLLDVQHGTLGREPLNLEKMECDCGRHFTMYDFIFTAIVDAGHSKSFILHTLVGSKYVIQEPRSIRCSACGLLKVVVTHYKCPRYACTTVVVGKKSAKE
jgi:hypothetical protein